VSADHSESGDPKLVVDADFVDNLDALGRDLNDVEALARAALAGQPLDHELAERVSTAPTALSYTAITEHNRERRSAEAWGEADLNDMIDPVAAEQLTTWRAAQRIDWEPSDFAVVGIAGFLGALANLYDHQIDSAVLGGLSWLKKPTFSVDGRKRQRACPSTTPDQSSGDPPTECDQPATISAASSKDSTKSAPAHSGAPCGKTVSASPQS
jgi:hypothetical protein